MLFGLSMLHFIVINWEGINVTRSIDVRMTRQNLNTNQENVSFCYCHVSDFTIFCILNVFNRTIMTKKLTEFIYTQYNLVSSLPSMCAHSLSQSILASYVYYPINNCKVNMQVVTNTIKLHTCTQKILTKKQKWELFIRCYENWVFLLP